jgi:ferrous iron transport protein A
MPVLPLSLLSPNQRARVVSVSGGRGLVKRLNDMGFSPGAEVAVLNRAMAGPLMVMVRGTKVAIGRGLATKIMVNQE